MMLYKNTYQPAAPLFEWDFDRTVFLRDDGKWINQRNSSQEDATEHDSQEEAIVAAKRMIQDQNGGELIVFSREGKIVRFCEPGFDDDF